jgi:hypothetical protein
MNKFIEHLVSRYVCMWLKNRIDNRKFSNLYNVLFTYIYIYTRYLYIYIMYIHGVWWCSIFYVSNSRLFYPTSPPFRAPIMVANLAETSEAGSITVEWNRRFANIKKCGKFGEIWCQVNIFMKSSLQEIWSTLGTIHLLYISVPHLIKSVLSVLSEAEPCLILRTDLSQSKWNINFSYLDQIPETST